MGSDVKIARALISVTDKTGVVDFARTLVDDFGVEIISTGGTARAIEDAGVPVTPIEEFTGYPEMMDGRVRPCTPRFMARCWPAAIPSSTCRRRLSTALS